MVRGLNQERHENGKVKRGGGEQGVMNLRKQVEKDAVGKHTCQLHKLTKKERPKSSLGKADLLEGLANESISEILEERSKGMRMDKRGASSQGDHEKSRRCFMLIESRKSGKKEKHLVRQTRGANAQDGNQER